MISMKNTCKICWVILGLFLLGNIILLGVWWLDTDAKQKNETRRFSKEDHRLEMREHLLRHTNITEAQFDQMYQLWKEHAKYMYKGQTELDSLRQQLMSETFNSHSDTFAVERLLNKLSVKQRKINEANYFHFRKLRNICETDEQREMLDKLLRSRMMHDGHKKRFRGRGKRH